WVYQILPYMEQENVWKIPYKGKDKDKYNQDIAEREIRGTLLPFCFCPSRRLPMRVHDDRYGDSARLDYSGNGGTAPHAPPPAAGEAARVDPRPLWFRAPRWDECRVRGRIATLHRV